VTYTTHFVRFGPHTVIKNHNLPDTTVCAALF